MFVCVNQICILDLMLQDLHEPGSYMVLFSMTYISSLDL